MSRRPGSAGLHRRDGLFIFALHWMNTPGDGPRTASTPAWPGMAIAIVATWAQPEVVHHVWIMLALVAGVAVGVPLSRVPLTAVPQRTALSHAFGGLAAGLVGTAKYYLLARRRAGESHRLPDDRDHRRGASSAF